MYFLILGRSDSKKKTYKKNHKKFRNRRPWYPGTTLKVNFHIIGLTKCTICRKKCSCFSLCFYYDHFSDRFKELFQVKSGLTTSLLFFLENAKNLVCLMRFAGGLALVHISGVPVPCDRHVVRPRKPGLQTILSPSRHRSYQSGLVSSSK